MEDGSWLTEDLIREGRIRAQGMITERLEAAHPPNEGADWVGVSDLIRAHSPSSLADLDALVAKARNVWQGTDTFTQAQAQKILAGLVLVVARHLR